MLISLFLGYLKRAAGHNSETNQVHENVMFLFVSTKKIPSQGTVLFSYKPTTFGKTGQRCLNQSGLGDHRKELSKFAAVYIMLKSLGLLKEILFCVVVCA